MHLHGFSQSQIWPWALMSISISNLKFYSMLLGVVSKIRDAWNAWNVSALLYNHQLIADVIMCSSFPSVRIPSAIRYAHFGVASPSYQPTWPCGNLRNPPEPSAPLRHLRFQPEPSGTGPHLDLPPSESFRNLRLPPAPAHIESIWAEDSISLRCWGKITLIKG